MGAVLEGVLTPALAGGCDPILPTRTCRCDHADRASQLDPIPATMMSELCVQTHSNHTEPTLFVSLTGPNNIISRFLLIRLFSAGPELLYRSW
jgi:hypothetical protein